jgi:hypothetical protein
MPMLTRGGEVVAGQALLDNGADTMESLTLLLSPGLAAHSLGGNLIFAVGPLPDKARTPAQLLSACSYACMSIG